MSESKPVKLPKIYFDHKCDKYWLALEQHRRFLNLGSRDCKLHLKRLGFYTDTEDNYGLKSGDRELVKSQINNFVDYAGPLAGHKIGFKELKPSGTRLLVTEETRPVQPKAGDCADFEKFWSELLGSEQAMVLYAWLKTSHESLNEEDFRPAPMPVFAGPSGCGKSFAQLMITHFLGGRSAKPYRYMIGETAFNADLAQAEHLMIEDEYASSDIRSRRKFGASIKEFTVNTEMSVHAKGRQALTLPTWKRLTCSVNDEPENLMILPPMDNSILDKVILFKCQHADLSSNRKAQLNKFLKQLPAFAHELLKWQIPVKLRDNRYGVKAWHHPELLNVLADISPENRLLSLIEEVLFPEGLLLQGKGLPPLKEHSDFRGTAEELERKLRNSPFAFAVEKLLYFSSACGVYLARLASKMPDRFESRRSHGRTVWIIKPQHKRTENA